jgi:hypothetical protein
MGSDFVVCGENEAVETGLAVKSRPGGRVQIPHCSTGYTVNPQTTKSDPHMRALGLWNSTFFTDFVDQIVRWVSTRKIRLFSNESRLRQIDKVYESPVAKRGLDDELIAVDFSDSLIPIRLWLSNLRTDVTVVSWKIDDLLRGEVGQVDGRLSAIEISPGHKQDQWAARNLKIARIPSANVFELAAPNCQHLGIGGAVDI